MGGKKKQWERKKKKREIILILAREGQPGSCICGGGRGEGEVSFGRDGTWVSVSGVLVKVVAITGAGRTINQQRPRGGAGALTGTLHSAQDTRTHTRAHTPADRLTRCFSPLSFHFCSRGSSCFLPVVLLSRLISLSSSFSSLSFLCPLPNPLRFCPYAFSCSYCISSPLPSS